MHHTHLHQNESDGYHMKNMSIKTDYGKEYLPTIEAILSHKNKKESRAKILLDC
jgi:hypothetical protein